MSDTHGPSTSSFEFDTPCRRSPRLTAAIPSKYSPMMPSTARRAKDLPSGIYFVSGTAKTRDDKPCTTDFGSGSSGKKSEVLSVSFKSPLILKERMSENERNPSQIEVYCE